MSDILTKIKSTADILGGDVFFATEDGRDPEILENGDLLANGMYIRLNGSDGSVAYISAFELDKSIEVIDQITKGKANKADLDVLRLLVDEKSNQSDFELLQSEMTTKASQESVDSIITALANKADSSVVEELITTVANKADSSVVEELTTEVTSKANFSVVEELITTVANKANAETVESIQSEIETLKETLETLTSESSIAAIQAQISYLNTELNKKLGQDDIESINLDVDELQSDVETLKTRIESAEASILKKAEKTFVQGQVNEIHGILANMTTAIDEKANKTDLALKANKTDVDNLRSKVTELNTTVGTTVSNLDSNYQTLVNELGSKADKSDTEEAIENLSTELTLKADKLETQRSINTIATRVTSLENADNGLSEVNEAINNLQCNVNSAITEMNSLINSQSKQITNHTKDIASLKSQDEEHKVALKNEWVKVMTPEEYKRLAPIGSGRLNAKQANTVYMLVRYNKPISVYIGDILIAQAEEKGSQSFIYSFPITF